MINTPSSFELAQIAAILMLSDQTCRDDYTWALQKAYELWCEAGNVIKAEGL